MDDNKDLNVENKKINVNDNIEFNQNERDDNIVKHIYTNEERNKFLMYVKLRNVIYYILGIIESLLGFRFLLKLLAANPRNAFVNFVYSITSVLAAPFFGIFSNATLNNTGLAYIFESGILIAMIVYALIAIGIVKLLKISYIEHVR